MLSVLLCIGCEPDFPASDFKFLLDIGFELGLFFWAGRRFHFHNPLQYISLRSFWAFGEIGFVYSD